MGAPGSRRLLGTGKKGGSRGHQMLLAATGKGQKSKPRQTPLQMQPVKRPLPADDTPLASAKKQRPSNEWDPLPHLNLGLSDAHLEPTPRHASAATPAAYTNLPGAQMSPTLGKRPQAIITFQRSGLEAPRPIPSAPRPQQPFRPGGGRVGRLGGLQPWFRSTTMSSQGGPAGMVNLGNTCYLNAVLQVLLSLQGFVGDLRRAQQDLGEELPPGGVAAALLECVRARDSSSGRPTQDIAPVSLKKAMGARLAAFEGTFQQDAHEFFCGLLDVLQQEVVGAEAARLGRPLVRISETDDPAARSFSFAVCHELTCSHCQHQSRVTEEFMHLSLELPPFDPATTVPPDVNTLLQAYFKEEEVEKRCESCGEASAPHRLRHSIKRMPRVLALHMKRFQIAIGPEGAPSCLKLHCPVGIPTMVRLGGFATPSTLPPLAPRPAPPASPGKENRGRAANLASVATGPALPVLAAAGGSREAGSSTPDMLPRKSPAHDLPQLRGNSFYGGAAGQGTGGLLGAVGMGSAPGVPGDGEVTPTHAIIRARAVAPACLAVPRLGQSLLGEEDEDEQLQRAMELSLLEAHHGGHSAAAGPGPGAGAVSSAAAAAAGAERPGAQQQQRQQGQGQAVLDLCSPARRSPAGSAAHGLVALAEAGSRAAMTVPGSSSQEDRDLRLALELSLQQQQPPPQQQQQVQRQGQGQQGARGEDDDDEELQRALRASLLDCHPTAQQQQQEEPQQQQRQEGQGGSPPPRPPAAALDLFNEVLQREEQGGGSSGSRDRSSLLVQEPELGGHPEKAGGEEVVVVEGEGEAAQQVQQARPMARIVEDDADVGDGSTAPEGAGSRDGSGAEGVETLPEPQLKQAPPSKKVLFQYRLHGVINHSGPSALCGHFTADVCDPATRAWHRHNDSLVTRMAASEATGSASQRECYMLFYLFED